MADTKISALTAVTTPLAGTEVAPVVQSSTTKKATVAEILGAVYNGATQYYTPYADSNKVLQWGSALRQDGTSVGIGANPNSANGKLYILNGRIGVTNGYNIGSTDGNTGFYMGVNSINMQTGGTNAWEVNSTSNFVQKVAAKGINFTANSAAAGMTSQLLNWYEEGTFTPTVRGSITAGTATYANQKGSYTRIGRMVYFQIYVDWSAGTGTGNLQIAGLPYTSANNSTYPSVTLGQMNNIATTALYIPCANVANSGSYIDFNQYPVGGGAVINIPYDGAGYIMCSGAYPV